MRTCLSLFLGFFLCSVAFAQSVGLSGNQFDYVVVSGDYLIRIGARFGVSAKVIARENHLDYGALLFPGKRLHLDNRHIVPEGMADGILINLPQRMLFFFRGGKLQNAYPVGLGKPSWPTPEGAFSVVDREENKAWIVPKSIQEEMLREGKAVLTKVPPGPDDPLGKYWMGISISGYGIHGTIAPASIYHFQSHGCIRMHPDDIAAFYGKVSIGTRVDIIYRPLLIAVEGNGRIFLESHPDIYRKGSDYQKAAHELAGAAGSRVDWRLAEKVIEMQDGVARDVTLGKK